MTGYHHVDLRVGDMRRAFPFYARLLREVGFPVDCSDDEWKVFSASSDRGSAYFAFTEQPDHVPSATRIAFRGTSPADVDRIAALARELGARDVSGPRACPEYSPTYYAVFFADPCGNSLEVCYRTD